MDTPIKIFLIEDNPEYRKSLDTAFRHDLRIQLIHATGTAERALDLLFDMRAADRPDLILLDLKLPGMSGIQAIHSLLGIAPHTKILVLSQSDKEADVVTAIASGASGYILKSSSILEITEAIETVMQGGAPLDKKVAKYILKTLQAIPHSGKDTHNLTEREMETLTLLAAGLGKKQIGDKLGISEFTVAAYVRSIYTKLEVVNAPAAVSQAYRKGILTTGFPESRD